MNDKIFFSEDGVSVSNTQVIVNGQSHALNNVVWISTDKLRPKRLFIGVSLLLGALMLIDEGALFVLGGFAVVLGMLALFTSKNKYSVTLNSTLGASRILLSTNRSHVERVTEALQDAMANRVQSIDERDQSINPAPAISSQYGFRIR